MKEYGTWLHFLYSFHILPKWIPEAVPVTWFVSLLLCISVIIASKNLKTRNISRYQAFWEFVVGALDGFVRNIVGDNEKIMTPIIGTLFIFILSLNLIGIIPGFMSPTSNINTTVSLALMAFVFVQVMGIVRVGPWNYFKHFLGDPIWMCPLMFPIHVIGELARPLSLSIRLFGNIFGDDTVVAVIILIVTMMLGKIPLPVQFPMDLFRIFGGFIQALVFSVLVSIYVALAVAHEEHE